MHTLSVLSLSSFFLSSQNYSSFSFFVRTKTKCFILSVESFLFFSIFHLPSSLSLTFSFSLVSYQIARRAERWILGLGTALLLRRSAMHSDPTPTPSFFPLSLSWYVCICPPLKLSLAAPSKQNCKSRPNAVHTLRPCVLAFTTEIN